LPSSCSPSRRTTTATPTSPRFGSGTPSTATSATAGRLLALDRPCGWDNHPFGDKLIAVKPNNLWSEWGREDLEALAGLKMDVLSYPEARTADEIRTVAHALDASGSQAEIVVLLETPQSFLEIRGLATAPRVTGFNHAQGDLSANLGVALSERARRSSIRPPSWCSLRAPTTCSPALSRRYFESSKRLGFQASSTFYAPHVDGINEVFSPSGRELADVREILLEYEKVKRQGRAAYVRPDGKWITVHQFRQAQDLIAKIG